MDSTTGQSSISRCDGGAACVPRFSLVATIPVSKYDCRTRFASHFAKVRRVGGAPQGSGCRKQRNARHNLCRWLEDVSAPTGVWCACRTSCEIFPYASSAVRRTCAFACYHSGTVCATVEGGPLHYRAPLVARHPERPREPRPAAMRSAGEGVGFSCSTRQHEADPHFGFAIAGTRRRQKGPVLLDFGGASARAPGPRGGPADSTTWSSLPPERSRRNGSEISISRPKRAKSHEIAARGHSAVRERHLAQAKPDQQQPHCWDLPPRASSAAGAVPCHEDILTCHIADILRH